MVSYCSNRSFQTRLHKTQYCCTLFIWHPPTFQELEHVCYHGIFGIFWCWRINQGQTDRPSPQQPGKQTSRNSHNLFKYLVCKWFNLPVPTWSYSCCLKDTGRTGQARTVDSTFGPNRRGTRMAILYIAHKKCIAQDCSGCANWILPPFMTGLGYGDNKAGIDWVSEVHLLNFPGHWRVGFNYIREGTKNGSIYFLVNLCVSELVHCVVPLWKLQFYILEICKVKYWSSIEATIWQAGISFFSVYLQFRKFFLCHSHGKSYNY